MSLICQTFDVIQSIHVSFLKIFWLPDPEGVTSFCVVRSFCIVPVVADAFFTFWHDKILSIYFVHFLSWTCTQPFLQTALFPLKKQIFREYNLVASSASCYWIGYYFCLFNVQSYISLIHTGIFSSTWKFQGFV